ncbi:dihydrofolate reductase family protein [Cellulomonas sp. ICMP 17802]|uniref:dihydrofolate reductase family protein n=1 Tax=Cellulomonas sp. ICMP 17802 TaxID=3239199 RepID=UPI00351B9E8C
MGIVRVSASVSLDGFSAGPETSHEHPLGIGGERLHRWLFPDDGDRDVPAGGTGAVGDDAAVAARQYADTGAVVVGRLTYDIGVDLWGDVPFPVPTFVVTHRPHEPRAMMSATFTFVTDGVASAVAQARAAAGDRDVLVMGGAAISRQVIAADLADELLLTLVPVLLHRGERLLDHVGTGLTELERTEVVTTAQATHLRYRFLR